MSTSQVGKTTLRVPPLCFGTSGLGSMPDTYGYEVDEARALATVEAIFNSESAFLDTSNNYGFGRSEKRIGEAIRAHGGLPSHAIVATKLDRDMESGRFDAAQARRSIEQSLSTLGLDCVHILHLHDPEYAASLDEITAQGGALAELFKMKEEGLTQAVGLAAGRIDVMMPLLRSYDFDCLVSHNRYTLLNRNAEPMFALAYKRGISVFNAAPYASGILAKGASTNAPYVYQNPSDEMRASIRELEAVCANHDVPLGAVALQFSLRQARICSTICGVTKPERVHETEQWAKLAIPDALWSELAAVEFSRDDPETSRQYRPG